MKGLIRSASLTNFAEVARKVGLDPGRMLSEFGLPRHCLRDPDLKVPVESVRRLLETAAERSGVEAFGLLMAETRQLSNLGPVGLLVREQPTVRLAVDGGLLGIALFSLAIRRPFTLQYARERVPEQYWGLPIFLTTNRIITSVWAATFAIHVAADAAAQYVAAIPIWVDVVVSIAAFVGAVIFTRRYPEAVRRRAIASALG